MATFKYSSYRYRKLLFTGFTFVSFTIREMIYFFVFAMWANRFTVFPYLFYQVFSTLCITLKMCSYLNNAIEFIFRTHVISFFVHQLIFQSELGQSQICSAYLHLPSVELSFSVQVLLLLVLLRFSYIRLWLLYDTIIRKVTI